MKVEEQQKVFSHWMNDHVGLMLKVVRSFASTSHDQDDLFQDVLVKLWTSVPAFRGESSETTWIYRVALNTAMAWRRGEHRWRERLSELRESGVAQLVDTTESDSQTTNENIDRLYAAIRQLNKIDASLAIMHLDGLSYREMAHVLGISENHIGVKLHRIRNELSARLKGGFDEH